MTKPNQSTKNDTSAAAKPAEAAKAEAKAAIKAVATTKGAEAKQPKMTAEERAWEIRRTRIRRILAQFLVAVGIPTLLAVVYYTTWAADEYESVASVMVQSPADSGDSLGAGNFVSNNASDINMFKSAAQSRQTMSELVESHGWREHYTSGGNMFSGLADDAGSEASFNYFRSRVSVKGKKGAALRVSVRAFSPEAAQKLSGAMIDIAEKRINQVVLSPIRAQLDSANKSLKGATTELFTLVQKHLPSQAAPDQAAHVEPAELLAARKTVAELRTIVANLERRRDGQARYVSILSPPSAPDEARYPKRLWGIATVFVISLAMMGILGLLLGTIREHAKL